MVECNERGLLAWGWRGRADEQEGTRGSKLAGLAIPEIPSFGYKLFYY